MIRERIIRYRGENITILFSIDRCTHYAACLDGAPEVFDSLKRPWINPDGASPDKTAKVIITCPTGALHFERRDGGAPESAPGTNTVIIEAQGPLYIHGDLIVKDQDGNILHKDTRIAFCRCGLSKIKPFCDNTHARVGFEEAEGFELNKFHAGIKDLPSGRLIVELRKNGPIRLIGPVTIKNVNEDILFQGTKTLLCRCGHSRKMPFCDGSHTRAEFDSEADCARII